MLLVAFTVQVFCIAFSAAQCPAGEGYIGPCFGGLCPEGTCFNTTESCCAPIPTTTSTFGITTTNPFGFTTPFGVTTSTVFMSSTTTTIPCNDIATNCAPNTAYCNNTLYYGVMTQQCARTCNRCPTAPACADTNSQCPVYARNGFCQSTYYTLAQRQQTCPLSCGFCQG